MPKVSCSPTEAVGIWISRSTQSMMTLMFGCVDSLPKFNGKTWGQKFVSLLVIRNVSSVRGFSTKGVSRLLIGVFVALNSRCDHHSTYNQGSAPSLGARLDDTIYPSRICDIEVYPSTSFAAFLILHWFRSSETIFAEDKSFRGHALWFRQVYLRNEAAKPFCFLNLTYLWI